jgi:hypothetical protein
MTASVAQSSGRLRAVRILSALMAVSAISFGLFTLVFGIVNPAQAPHAFHNVLVAGLLIVLSAPPLIAVARDPQRGGRPLVILAAIAIAGLATMALAVTLDPFTLPFVVLIGVLWALLPDRSGAFPAGRVSRILLLLVLLAAVPLARYALDQAGIQRVDHESEHAAFYHWVETSFYATAVLFLGLLAALRPVAYRMAAWCAGVGLTLLGLASLAFAGYASALPEPWGWIALGGGVVFLAAAEWEVRRT